MFVLPLGDEPNPPGTPLLTYALILVNCAAYVLITLPLGSVRPEWADPMVQEYLRAWVEALGEPVSRGDVAAMCLPAGADRHPAAFRRQLFRGRTAQPVACAGNDCNTIFESQFKHSACSPAAAPSGRLADPTDRAGGPQSYRRDG